MESDYYVKREKNTKRIWPIIGMEYIHCKHVNTYTYLRTARPLLWFSFLPSLGKPLCLHFLSLSIEHLT